ncbi:trans-aconitate methyltransferase [Pseudooceanicola batsensis HTCC2597]|uniref:Trans-aconitate methyltransferase n=1 Tax=Pseudooceanicola batsensis (strain ATCC BAA-863 / DSM 15984 / KCTC 12145 / HTCC2597) TaxID=252305 RepID=A3TZ19_PSEBH|nr:methyltransferase domain-containing protein [Pseudooceanicola batsensis]EAQ02837.1 trans-aconitate methyltransferase [Pseudooceanicola batsensis HTCC2597]
MRDEGGEGMTDWNPQQYSRFAGLRLRPAVDLVMRLPALAEGAIVDLGCGNGGVGPVLRTRFPNARIVGIDSSPAMLAEAWKTGAYDALSEEDIATWHPGSPPEIIFSNAALHWLPDHQTLVPSLVDRLAPGGTLAVQVPHQNHAPSHRLWLDLVAQHFPGRVDPDAMPGIPDARTTWAILDGLGSVAMWETEYMQPLDASDEAHPVRLFTASTFARPVLEALDPEERDRIGALYDEAMETAYPRRPDGTVLFPFKRMFYTLTRPT